MRPRVCAYMCVSGCCVWYSFHLSRRRARPPETRSNFQNSTRRLARAAYLDRLFVRDDCSWVLVRQLHLQSLPRLRVPQPDCQRSSRRGRSTNLAQPHSHAECQPRAFSSRACVGLSERNFSFEIRGGGGVFWTAYQAREHLLLAQRRHFLNSMQMHPASEMVANNTATLAELSPAWPMLQVHHPRAAPAPPEF